MSLGGDEVGTGPERDPAYPTSTPPDAVYPCQTRVPIGPPLDGVIAPALWSRIARPLERALSGLWEELGLLVRGRPASCVAIHFGRIALNAHAWERLCAAASGLAPDPSLVGPEPRGLARLPELFEGARVRARRGRVRRRLAGAESTAAAALASAERCRPGELDTPRLARGPLDERAWAEVLTPWLAVRLCAPARSDALAWGPQRAPAEAVRRAVSLEARFGAEVGRRLRDNGQTRERSAVAFLTVAELLRAVHDAAPLWAELALERRGRVERFAAVDVPREFWGRPRVDGGKNG